jgi:hypothetical protein
LYFRSLEFFNALDAPAMFTPGDNDWTDCDRPSNGGYSSRERLDRERLIFFSTPYSLGRRPLLQQVQTEPLCLGVNGPVACVENQRWTVGRVTFATINVQGYVDPRSRDVFSVQPMIVPGNRVAVPAP